MKTAAELMEEAWAKDDWKTLKLWAWANAYEAKAIEWNEIFPPVKDDRRVFINAYKQVYDAIDSLPDNPCSWICCAVNHELEKEREMMDDIISRFA